MCIFAKTDLDCAIIEKLMDRLLKKIDDFRAGQEIELSNFDLTMIRKFKELTEKNIKGFGYRPSSEKELTEAEIFLEVAEKFNELSVQIFFLSLEKTQEGLGKTHISRQNILGFFSVSEKPKRYQSQNFTSINAIQVEDRKIENREKYGYNLFLATDETRFLESNIEFNDFVDITTEVKKEIEELDEETKKKDGQNIVGVEIKYFRKVIHETSLLAVLEQILEKKDQRGKAE